MCSFTNAFISSGAVYILISSTDNIFSFVAAFNWSKPKLAVYICNVYEGMSYYISIILPSNGVTIQARLNTKYKGYLNKDWTVVSTVEGTFI